MKAKFNKLFTLLTILTLGFGQMWADETYYLQDPAKTNGTPALTGDFYTTAALSFSVNKAYDAVTYKNGLTFGGNLTSLGSNCKNSNYQVRYDCKTNSTEFTVLMYATNTSKTLNYYTIQENASIGSACTVSSLSTETMTNGVIAAKTLTVSNSTRTSVYFAVNDKGKATICQIIAVEKGTAFPKPGEAGYSVNFNKGRYIAASGKVGTLDETPAYSGLEMHMNTDYYYSTTAGKMQTNGTNYIKFAVEKPMVLNFTTSSTSQYNVSTTKGGDANKITPTANVAKKINLTAAGTYYINPQGSNVTPTGMVFSAAPKVTYNANGGDGSMDQSYFTVSANGFTPPTGQEFTGWKDGSDNDYSVGDEVETDVTLYAQWGSAVDRYTVVYKDEDGTTDLGYEDVEVGDHPAATGITAKKEWYTFASWQLSGSDIALDAASWASVVKDETVTLTARYSGPNYASTLDFAAITIAGTTASNPIEDFLASGNMIASNLYGTSAWETSTAKSGFMGYKLRNKSAVVKFLVQAGKQVVITFGNIGADVTLSKDGVNSTIPTAAGDDAETVVPAFIPAADMIVTITTSSSSSSTVTIKKIAINSLFSATYTDGTGDASGSASDVAEVTLPAPTATTVGGNTFTGWTANQIVKVGGVDQSIGTELTAGTVVELTANTTFTAVWVTTSDFDVKFFPGYGANDQIGTTQSISTGNYATPEADPTRSGYRFLGWSTDGTEANIVDVASYGITAATDFTAVWVQQFEVTFNLQGYGSAIAAQNVDNGGKIAKPADPFEGGQEFIGWYKESTCENAWDFATDVVTEPTELFAKWVAFTGCVMLRPATSGSAPAAVGDEIVMQSGSTGATMTALANVGNLTYTANGLQFGSASGTKVNVVLNNDMAVGTTISMKLVAAGTGTRGLFLYTSAGTKINAFTCWVDGTNPATNGAVETFTYTVTAGDGLEGTNEFQLWRNNTVILNTLKVESCGSAVIFHDLTSAITPDHDPAYATVTLSASSVREGHTATAEYSAIDPAYEFDEWQISGTDASIADASANPAVITMGTADAVVTLKLKVATVKHNVTFNTHGGSTVASQEVEDGANPVAPADPTKDEYIFQGWAEVEDGAIVDVTSFAITADKEFHAVWVAEPAGIKLINGDGSINTVNFTTGVTASTVNFDDADHNCAVFGSTGGSIVGLTGLNKVVAYNATTTQTKVKFVLYNTNSSAKELYLQKVLEGATEAVTETISVPSKERYETLYYTYNSSDLRSFYVTVNSTNIRILQMKVIEDGAVLPRAGETGYELNLNLGRVFGAQGVETAFEGLTFAPSSNAKVLNSTELPITTPLSFTIATPLTLTVTTSSAKYYVSQNSAEDGTTATAITAAGTETFDLTATGTWYIVPSTTSAVKLTNIAFSAPRPDRTITFDSDGGSAVADIVVKDGEVAVAPADPTKDDNDFAGWYLGADPYDWSAAVTADIELTAHWTAHVNNDATLSALSYGGNAITLSDGVYEYDVNLPALTLAVPALTAVPNAALATADVTDAADFDGAGQATSTVLVTAEDNTTQLTYTVNFTKAALLPQVDVTENTTWDWANIASENITLTDLKNYECVLANVEGVTNDATFNSQALLFCGERVRNVENTRTFATIGHISFNVTVAGTVRVEFSDNGTNNRRVKINDEQSDPSANKTDVKTFEADVTAGIVTIMGISEDGASTNQYVRISRIEFEVAAPTKDLVRDGLSNGKWGTLCPKQTVENVEGATFYQIAYLEEQAGLPYNMVWDAISGTTLEAGKPYFFIANATEIRGNKTGAELDAAGAAVNGFYGWISPTDEKKPLSWRVDYDPTGDNTFVIYNNEVLRLNADGTELRSERCYININATEPTRTGVAPMPGRDRIRMSIAGVSVVTGMEEITNDQSQMTNKVIIDGHLYILRGEKMYDATGRQVK